MLQGPQINGVGRIQRQRSISLGHHPFTLVDYSRLRHYTRLHTRTLLRACLRASRELLEYELHSVGIRLNCTKPNIYLKPKNAGGVSFNATCKLTKIDQVRVCSRFGFVAHWLKATSTRSRIAMATLASRDFFHLQAQNTQTITITAQHQRPTPHQY